MRFGSDRSLAPDGWFCRLGAVVLLTMLAFGAQAQNKCSAAGLLGGEKFVANHCAVALYASQHSVAIWFNEDPITAQEEAEFQTSATVDPAKNGKQRTWVLIMFCPGGGATTASPAAVKSMSLASNHAKSVLAGIKWNVKAARDFKVVALSGEVKPGATLAGQMIGKWRKTTWNTTFNVKLPTTESATGMSCGK